MKYFLLLTLSYLIFACSKDSSNNPSAAIGDDSLKIKEVISSLLSEISSETMSNCMKDLTAIPSRQTNTTGCIQARDYLLQEFNKPGWNVSTAEFLNENKTAYNIVVEKKGIDTTGKVVIVCAHYDSWDGGNAGANDNASGCAGLVALQESLTKVKVSFNHTIRLIAFAGEEQGLVGSNYYVRSVDSNSVLAVINLDGIAPKTTELTSILISYKKTYSNWLVNEVNRINRVYSNSTGFQNIYVYNNHHWGTDTDPFWNKGISGVWILGNGEYPYANTLQDTFDKVDPVYGSRLMKTVGAVAFTLAEPVLDNN